MQLFVKKDIERTEYVILLTHLQGIETRCSNIFSMFLNPTGCLKIIFKK